MYASLIKTAQFCITFISESSIYFSHTEYHFEENVGVVDIEIIREGSDLSHSSMVWCATKLSNPPSATPGQDYVPSSSQLTFGPGQTSQVNKIILHSCRHLKFQLLSYLSYDATQEKGSYAVC